jgi:hypothetical protein
MRVRRVVVVGTAMAAACAFACVFACVGTTGGELVTFPAAAAGPADADPGRPFEFSTGGWHVVLTKAVLHVGALYLLQSKPTSGAQGLDCILPDNFGTYVGQVTPALSPDAGLDVDLLSPALQRFSVQGTGTTIPPALTGQVWLTGGSINSAVDNTPILVVAGTADDRRGTFFPFEGTITISTNRQGKDSQTAGVSPICKQRIVSPIPIDVSVRVTGGLILRIDPRQLFNLVDFGQLTKPDGSDTYRFVDETSPDASAQPSTNLYANLRSAGALYTFTWSDNL